MTELERLREENAQLREMVFGVSLWAPLAAEFGLTVSEAKILGTIVSRGLATHDAIDAALYWDRGETRECESVIRAMISQMRRKLPAWAHPVSVWGQGYRLEPEARARLKALLQAEAA